MLQTFVSAIDLKFAKGELDNPHGNVLSATFGKHRGVEFQPTALFAANKPENTGNALAM